MLFLLLSRYHRLRAGDVPSFGRFIRRLEWLLLVLVAMGVSYGIAEHASWFDSFWLVWQTVTTVGYGDIPPKTVVGRSGVMICGVVGIVLFSYVVSAGLEYREEQSRRKKTGMETNPESGSYLLVCCRNQDQLETLIKELRGVDADAAVCVVDDTMEELPARVARRHGVHFVHGPILAKETYERAGIRSCKQVIVFPHEPGKGASDAVTRALVAMAEHHAPTDVPVMYFLVDPANAGLFDGVRAKAVHMDFALFAAIQECQEPGSAEIFTTLMSKVDGASLSTYAPKDLVGWTWGELLAALPKASQRLGIPINPLALLTAGKPDPCPEMTRKIKEGDRLSLIVHKGFSYSDFETTMAEIR